MLAAQHTDGRDAVNRGSVGASRQGRIDAVLVHYGRVFETNSRAKIFFVMFGGLERQRRDPGG